MTTAREQAREAAANYRHTDSRFVGPINLADERNIADAASDVWARRIVDCQAGTNEHGPYFLTAKLRALLAEAKEMLDDNS